MQRPSLLVAQGTSMRSRKGSWTSAI